MPSANEDEYARYAAQRKLWSVQFGKRLSRWIFPGIRSEYRAGLYVDKIKIINPDDDTDKDYIIKSPIYNVTYNFIDYTTTIGGLMYKV